MSLSRFCHHVRLSEPGNQPDELIVPCRGDPRQKNRFIWGREKKSVLCRWPQAPSEPTTASCHVLPGASVFNSLPLHFYYRVRHSFSSFLLLQVHFRQCATIVFNQRNYLSSNKTFLLVFISWFWSFPAAVFHCASASDAWGSLDFSCLFWIVCFICSTHRPFVKFKV